MSKHIYYCQTSLEQRERDLASETRIATRTGTDAPVYFLQDHLGSTTITTNSSGNFIAEMMYKAWGEVRHTSGTTPTNYTYTGQYSNTVDFGLMYYGARWYDSSLSRFAQADTIITSIGEGGDPNSIGYMANANYSSLVVNNSENQLLAQLNNENRERLQNPNAVFSSVPIKPLAFDRYAYCFNNPMNYNDPTGHFAFSAVLAFIPVYGWIALGAFAVGAVIWYAMDGPQALANALAPSSVSTFSRNDGGASQAAKHLAMLLGGQSVAGFAPHPGMPDPNGRDRKHNVEGLRNTLRDIRDNMRQGESIDSYLSRQGWSIQQIQQFTSAVNDYVNNVLATDIEYYGVTQDLADELIYLVLKIGIQ